ncbi:hypothetical protein Ae505Ps2_0524 [Pseudonocardia sp. Ae505_Ps2]|nr:hypothetical protein Ae505Ps2_0524 [Pseudonocardia sp. Ae505_Ps2]
MAETVSHRGHRRRCTRQQGGDPMPENTTSEEQTLIAAAEKLTQCDGYVVLAVDPQTGEVDAHGPFDGMTATIKADQLRRDFDRGGLEDVSIGVVRLHSQA